MVKTYLLILIFAITMSACEEKPKTTAADPVAVVFVNDTLNKKVEVHLNGSLFTNYLYQAELPKPVLFPLKTSSGKSLTRGFPIEPKKG